MSENTERRYLKWYNKIGYGSGDVAGNVVYAFLSSFVMILYLDGFRGHHQSFNLRPLNQDTCVQLVGLLVQRQILP